jgi:DNA-3-methyladenine glycosylase I
MQMKEKQRCTWCTSDEIYIRYHDEEWGVPEYDDRAWFESLCLEGQQAGLSWITVLRKREHYRRLFADFDAQKIVRFSDEKLASFLLDQGIVRNRLKVFGIRKNAQALLHHFPSAQQFSDFIWSFVADKPQIRRPHKLDDIVATTPESDAMSKALKQKGFTFVGSTICYAFMQANGLVDDHLAVCWKVKR